MDCSRRTVQVLFLVLLLRWFYAFFSSMLYNLLGMKNIVEETYLCWVGC